VVLPKSMKFEARSGAFREIRNRVGADVHLASAVRAGQPLAFRISGTGTMMANRGGRQSTAAVQDDIGRGESAGSAPSVAAAAPPEMAPTYRWVTLGGLGLVLVAVALGAARARKHSRERSARASKWRQRPRVCA
jgi:hypothetical protein